MSGVAPPTMPVVSPKPHALYSALHLAQFLHYLSYLLHLFCSFVLALTQSGPTVLAWSHLCQGAPFLPEFGT